MHSAPRTESKKCLIFGIHRGHTGIVSLSSANTYHLFAFSIFVSVSLRITLADLLPVDCVVFVLFNYFSFYSFCFCFGERTLFDWLSILFPFLLFDRGIAIEPIGWMGDIGRYAADRRLTLADTPQEHEANDYVYVYYSMFSVLIRSSSINSPSPYAA